MVCISSLRTAMMRKDLLANASTVTKEQRNSVAALGAKFFSYAPHFTGPAMPEQSVNDVLNVINKASLESGYGGSFILHLGNKQWL